MCRYYAWCDIACVNINGYHGCVGHSDDLVEVVLHHHHHHHRRGRILSLYVDDKIAFKNTIDSCMARANHCHSPVHPYVGCTIL